MRSSAPASFFLVAPSCIVARASSHQRCLPAPHTPGLPRFASPRFIPSLASCVQELSTGLFLTVTGEEVVLRERELRNVCRFDAWQRQARVRLTLALFISAAIMWQYTYIFIGHCVFREAADCSPRNRQAGRGINVFVLLFVEQVWRVQVGTISLEASHAGGGTCV